MNRMGLHLFLVVCLFSVYRPTNGAWDWCSRSSLDKQYRDGIFPLIDAVNSYRRANGLRKCDGVLVEVAYIHIQDQEAVHPLKSPDCPPNGHNWLSPIGWTLADIATLLPQYSNNVGNIKSCCFEKDGADCMWKKPRELYSWYKPYGFEVSVVLGTDLSGASPARAAKGAVEEWKRSKGHNDVILAKGDNWKKLKKIGCFHRGEFVSCWMSSGQD